MLDNNLVYNSMTSHPQTKPGTNLALGLTLDNRRLNSCHSQAVLHTTIVSAFWLLRDMLTPAFTHVHMRSNMLTRPSSHMGRRGMGVDSRTAANCWPDGAKT